MSKTASETIEQIRVLALQGKSSKEIGVALGKTAKAIQKLFVRHNLPHLPQGAQRGKKNHFYQQGYTVDKNGYKLILYPDHPFANSGGYVREHRLVMEQHLDRWLLPTEVVHHKDGNKKNNSIENLELFSRNSEHLKVELTGKTPKWSTDGILRIQKGVLKSLSSRGVSNPSVSKIGVSL